MMKNKSPEHTIQTEFIQWAKRSAAGLVSPHLPELENIYAIPNGGKRHISVAAKLKLEGVMPGVPDICLAWPSSVYHGLYIEFKVPGGRPSPNQKKWLAKLKKAGYKTAVAFSAEEGKAIIFDYLKKNNKK